MSKKLAEKAGLIKLPGDLLATSTKPVDTAAGAGGVPDARARTAPGTMAAFLGTQSAAVKEAEELRQKVQQFDGALPVRKLDPRQVKSSRWANRSEASFATKDFEDLKEEIRSAGGNVQPIKVRRIKGAPDEFELVYGHRRHRACLQLGLPVLALVADELLDADLFTEMERENRQRKDLGAYEQGLMYARALDAGLFQSNRRLADAIGRDLGDVGKALSLARLPKEVVDAFASPLDIQFRFAKPLNDEFERDPEGLVKRAREIAKLKQRPIAKDVLANLLNKSPAEHELKVTQLAKGGVQVATVERSKKGALSIQIPGGLEPQKELKLLKLMRELLGADK